MRSLIAFVALAASLVLCSFTGGSQSPTVTISNITQAGGADPQDAQFNFTYNDNGQGHDQVDITFVLKDPDGTVKGTGSGYVYNIPPNQGGQSAWRSSATTKEIWST